MASVAARLRSWALAVTPAGQAAAAQRVMRPLALVTPLALVPALFDPPSGSCRLRLISGLRFGALSRSPTASSCRPCRNAYRARAFGVMQGGLHLLQGGAVLFTGLARQPLPPAAGGRVCGARRRGLLMAVHRRHLAGARTIADATPPTRRRVAADARAPPRPGADEEPAGHHRARPRPRATRRPRPTRGPAQRRVPVADPAERTVDLAEHTGGCSVRPAAPMSRDRGKLTADVHPELLRRGRRRADVPQAGRRVLRRRGRRPGAAAAVPRGGPRTGRGAVPAVPDAVLGRPRHLLGAARPPAAADAARAVRGRPGRARRLAAAHAPGGRLARAGAGGRGHAVGVPGAGRHLHGQHPRGPPAIGSDRSCLK